MLQKSSTLEKTKHEIYHFAKHGVFCEGCDDQGCQNRQKINSMQQTMRSRNLQNDQYSLNNTPEFKPYQTVQQLENVNQLEVLELKAKKYSKKDYLNNSRIENGGAQKSGKQNSSTFQDSDDKDQLITKFKVEEETLNGTGTQTLSDLAHYASELDSIKNDITTECQKKVSQMLNEIMPQIGIAVDEKFHTLTEKLNEKMKKEKEQRVMLEHTVTQQLTEFDEKLRLDLKSHSSTQFNQTENVVLNLNLQLKNKQEEIDLTFQTMQQESEALFDKMILKYNQNQQAYTDKQFQQIENLEFLVNDHIQRSEHSNLNLRKEFLSSIDTKLNDFSKNYQINLQKQPSYSPTIIGNQPTVNMEVINKLQEQIQSFEVQLQIYSEQSLSKIKLFENQTNQAISNHTQQIELQIENQSKLSELQLTSQEDKIIEHIGQQTTDFTKQINLLSESFDLKQLEQDKRMSNIEFAASQKVGVKSEKSKSIGGEQGAKQEVQGASLQALQDKLDYKTIEIEHIQESIEEINKNLSEDQQAINGVLDGLETQIQDIVNQISSRIDEQEQMIQSELVYGLKVVQKDLSVVESMVADVADTNNDRYEELTEIVCEVSDLVKKKQSTKNSLDIDALRESNLDQEKSLHEFSQMAESNHTLQTIEENTYDELSKSVCQEADSELNTSYNKFHEQTRILEQQRMQYEKSLQDVQQQLNDIKNTSSKTPLQEVNIQDIEDKSDLQDVPSGRLSLDSVQEVKDPVTARIRELETQHQAPVVKKKKEQELDKNEMMNDIFATIQDASEYVETIFENVAKVNKLRLEAQEQERALATQTSQSKLKEPTHVKRPSRFNLEDEYDQNSLPSRFIDGQYQSNKAQFDVLKLPVRHTIASTSRDSHVKKNIQKDKMKPRPSKMYERIGPKVNSNNNVNLPRDDFSETSRSSFHMSQQEAATPGRTPTRIGGASQIPSLKITQFNKSVDKYEEPRVIYESPRKKQEKQSLGQKRGSFKAYLSQRGPKKQE